MRPQIPPRFKPGMTLALMFLLAFVSAGTLAGQFDGCPIKAKPPAGESVPVKPPAGQLRAKQEPPCDPASISEYLPALLEKTLLFEENKRLNSMELFVNSFETYEQGGVVAPRSVDQVRQKLLRSRVRWLHREKKYNDLMDKLSLRHDAGHKRLEEVEDFILSPLWNHIGKFSVVFAYHSVLMNELEHLNSVKPKELRRALQQMVGKAPLAKGTRFAQKITVHWAELGKRTDKELDLLTQKYLQELRQLQLERLDHKKAKESLSETKTKRLRDLDFEIDLLGFDLLLRRYERMEWQRNPENKKRDDPRPPVAFAKLLRTFTPLVARAVAERLNPLQETWPSLAPVKVGEVDLLHCDWSKAEKVLSSQLKERRAKVTGKIRLREVRTLVAVYEQERKLLESSFLQFFQAAFDKLYSPEQDSPLTDPVPVSSRTDSELSENFLRSQLALSRATAHLIRTWIGYQAARLGLYQELGITPPEFKK